MKKKIVKIIAIVSILIVAIAAIGIAYIAIPRHQAVVEASETRKSTEQSKTSQSSEPVELTEERKFVNEMGVGINIGNSLDVCDWNAKFTISSRPETYETTWGNVPISDGLIKMIADKGYGTVRIPVTYMNHIDGNGNVDPNWLLRITEVVNMVISHGMYCIIDIHHDTGNDGWIKASQKNYEQNHERVTTMITQIAECFKDYDDHLILEGFNEMVDDNNKWTEVPDGSLKAFNQWNQLFVDTVRGTGSNNATRYLLVNTYAASFDARNVDGFELPKDSVKNRILVGVHGYISSKEMDAGFDGIRRLYDKGFAIVISEFGSSGQSKVDRAEYTEDYSRRAAEIGACVLLWDDGSNAAKAVDVQNFAIMDRKNLRWYFPKIADALKNGHKTN